MKYKKIPKQKDIKYFKIRIDGKIQDAMKYNSTVKIDPVFLRLSKEADIIWDFWESQTDEQQLYDMLKTEFNI